MAAFQSRTYETTVRLLGVGTYGLTPLSGVLASQVTLNVRKTGAAGFSTKALDSTNWLPLGSGFYVIKWSAEDTTDVGEFRYWLSGAEFEDTTGTFDVEPAHLGIMAQPPMCVLIGNIIDLRGRPGQDQRIVVKNVKLPVTTTESFIQGGIVETGVDAMGNFSIPLLRKATVVIELEKAGVKQQLKVPDQPSVRLIDILSGLIPGLI